MVGMATKTPAWIIDRRLLKMFGVEKMETSANGIQPMREELRIKKARVMLRVMYAKLLS